MSEKRTEFLPGDDPHGDVEGHRLTELPDPVDDEAGERRIDLVDESADDVEGHVQPPRDLDIEF